MPEPIEWEQAACQVCGSVDRLPADGVSWRDARFEYVLCRTCGLKYMNPRPTARWYHAFYEREFWQEKLEYRGFRAKSPIAPLPSDEGWAKRLGKQRWRAERIARLVARTVSLGPSSLVVDVGTAFGVTLDLLRQRWQCQVAGVEPSLVSRDYAEREFGIGFLGRHFEDLYSPTVVDGQVSLVVMSQVLENILDPRAALHAVGRLLAPGGHLYIDTSNFFYYNAVNPYHPYIFSPATLEDLLAQCGFDVIDREHEPDPPAADAPVNRYLMFMARRGASLFHRCTVDAERLVADQGIGVARFSETRAAQKRQAAAMRTT